MKLLGSSAEEPNLPEAGGVAALVGGRVPRRLLERRQDAGGRRWSTAAPADLKVPGRGMRSCPSTPLRHMHRAAANAR
ncbi:hypothetical protein MTO96_019338 [Rhipicephalus appendiculatus]